MARWTIGIFFWPGVCSDTCVTFPNESIDRRVIGCAINAHRRLGPGLYESIYQTCLARELSKARLRFEEQVGVTITYDGERLPAAFRADFIVENAVVVEVKSIANALPIHHRQVLTYMRLS